MCRQHGSEWRALKTEPFLPQCLPTMPLSTPQWAKSKAKATLKAAILAGQAQDAMRPKEVWLMNAECQKFKCERFRSNLNTMWKAHRAGTLGKQKLVKWGKSDAKRLLRKDIVTQVV